MSQSERKAGQGGIQAYREQFESHIHWPGNACGPVLSVSCFYVRDTMLLARLAFQLYICSCEPQLWFFV
jgi:hypothetical protein